MPYSELTNSKEPVELTRDEKNGWTLEAGNRIITFRVKTFQAFADRIIELFGSKVGSVVLYQMGTAIGHAGMEYSKPQIRSEEDIGSVLDHVLGLRGWGRCVELKSRTMGSKKVYVAKMTWTPQSHDRTSNEPRCHMTRGVISGWLEGYFAGKVVESVERECASMGCPFCMFEIIIER